MWLRAGNAGDSLYVTSLHWMPPKCLMLGWVQGIEERMRPAHTHGEMGAGES